MPFLAIPALTSLGVSAAIAGPLSSILFTGISIGLSILFAPKVPKPEDGRVPFRQPVPPRIRIIGKRRVSGGSMLEYSTETGRYFSVRALCEGKANDVPRVDGTLRMWLHEDLIAFTGDNPQFEPGQHTVISYGNGRYGDGKIRIYTHYGLPTETAFEEPIHPDYGLNNDDNDFIWTEDFRGDGICSGLMVCDDDGAGDQGRRFPAGIPQPSWEIDATQVYDPRDDSNELTDSDTWTGEGAGGNLTPANWNPILQTVWFLTAPVSQLGMGLDIEQCFAPVMDQVIAQANVCDESVPVKVGDPEPRYQSGVMYTSKDDPGEVLSAILGTCDGFCAENGDGTFTLKAGKWDDDDFSVVISPKHVISLHVERFRPDEDEVTGVIVKYNDVVLHSHTEIDAPVWPRDAYQGGDDRRIRPIEVLYCPSGTQAQRLSKRVAIYEMAPIRFSATLKMYGILLLNKRGATLDLGDDDPALDNVKVKLTKVETNLVAGTIEISGVVFDPDECDAWNAGTEEGPLQPPVSTPIGGGETTPFLFAAVPVQIGNSIFVDLQFDPGEAAIGGNVEVEYDVRWRLTDIGEDVGGWTLQHFDSESVDRISDTLWVVTLNNMSEGVFDFQLRGIRRGNISSWSGPATADTTNPAPGRVTEFTAELVGANVELDWKAPNSANMDHATVYRDTVDDFTATATDISGEIDTDVFSNPVTARSIMDYTDTAPASGTYYYWVVAISDNGVSSTPRGSIQVIVP